MTLPLIHYAQQLPLRKRDAFAELVKSDHPLNGDRQPLLDALERSGSIVYAQDRAAELISRATQRLDALEPSNARDALLEAAGTVLHRGR